MAYATSADLATFTGAPETADDDRMLREASEDINDALRGAFYDPTDANIVLALQNATCAQVEYWRETGDELGVSGQYDDVMLGQLRLTRSGKRAPKLAPRAMRYLRLAGLLPITPVAW